MPQDHGGQAKIKSRNSHELGSKRIQGTTERYALCLSRKDEKERHVLPISRKVSKQSEVSQR